MMDILKRLSGFTDGMSNADVYKLVRDEIESLRAKLAQHTPSQSVDERAEFEKALRALGYQNIAFEKFENTEIYGHYHTEDMWRIWQARAKLDAQTPSQSEPVGWWLEGNDLDESDYYPAEHFPDLDTTGCIPLYTKPQPTSQDADTIGLIASKSILKVITEHGIEIYEGRKSQLHAKIQCAVIEAINAAKDGK